MDFNTDALGHEVKAGHYIVYAAMLGSKSVLKVYEVLEVRKSHTSLNEIFGDEDIYYTLHVRESILIDSACAGRVVKLKHPEKCLIVPQEYLKRAVE